eukprot:2477852-Rhodomonas_salina.2
MLFKIEVWTCFPRVAANAVGNASWVGVLCMLREVECKEVRGVSTKKHARMAVNAFIVTFEKVMSSSAAALFAPLTTNFYPREKFKGWRNGAERRMGALTVFRCATEPRSQKGQLDLVVVVPGLHPFASIYNLFTCLLRPGWLACHAACNKHSTTRGRSGPALVGAVGSKVSPYY